MSVIDNNSYIDIAPVMFHAVSDAALRKKDEALRMKEEAYEQAIRELRAEICAKKLLSAAMSGTLGLSKMTTLKFDEAIVAFRRSVELVPDGHEELKQEYEELLAHAEKALAERAEVDNGGETHAVAAG